MIELLQVVGTLLIVILGFIPIVHVVKSRYWSNDAKIGWGIAILFTYFIGYAIFLVATFLKLRKQNSDMETKENNSSSWFLWFLMLVGNGLILYLWIVFGFAGAASADSATLQPLILGAELGVTVPLLLSIYFMSKKKYSIGLAWNASIMPVVLTFTILIDLIKPAT